MNGTAWCFLILTSISLKPEMKINSTTVQWIRLKKIIQASLLLCGVFPFLAHGHVLSDLGGATAYWGGNAHGYGDVIGDSTYNVNGAEVSLSNSMLSIRILTNFAGHAGQDGWAGPTASDMEMFSSPNPGIRLAATLITLTTMPRMEPFGRTDSAWTTAEAIGRNVQGLCAQWGHECG
jgi:hypothetical protein